MFTRTK